MPYAPDPCRTRPGSSALRDRRGRSVCRRAPAPHRGACPPLRSAPPPLQCSRSPCTPLPHRAVADSHGSLPARRAARSPPRQARRSCPAARRARPAPPPAATPPPPSSRVSPPRACAAQPGPRRPRQTPACSAAGLLEISRPPATVPQGTPAAWYGLRVRLSLSAYVLPLLVCSRAALSVPVRTGSGVTQAVGGGGATVTPGQALALWLLARGGF
eukprot:scaffold1234_cov76-Phaeocystis_antarctica.AAC.3